MTNNWISVGERLPLLEDGSDYGSVDVLMWDGVFVQFGYYDYSRSAWTTYVRGIGEPYLIYHGVTHWMPLPTPPTP